LAARSIVRIRTIDLDLPNPFGRTDQPTVSESEIPDERAQQLRDAHGVGRTAAGAVRGFAVGEFGDIDGGPSKDLLTSRRDDPAVAKFFKLATDKRPAEEFYDLRKDAGQLNNVAGRAEYAKAKKQLRAALDKWMRDTGDPRATTDDDRWDHYPYFGNPGR